MFYHCNDYLVPVLIGDIKQIKPYASAILKKKKARPHIFGNSFSLFSKMRYYCHKVMPSGDFWLFAALFDFSAGLDDYYTPAIILCGEHDTDIYSKFGEELEKRFIVIKFEDYMNNEGELSE